MPSRDRRVSSSTLILRAHSPTLVPLPTLPALSRGGGGGFGASSTAAVAGGAAAMAGVNTISRSGCTCSDLLLCGGVGVVVRPFFPTVREETERFCSTHMVHNREKRQEDYLSYIAWKQTTTVHAWTRAASSPWSVLKRSAAPHQQKQHIEGPQYPEQRK